jgi:ribA/ribD-fused uncharacterized protein
MIKIEDRVTDTHVYFWGDPTLSNWGPAPFVYKGNHFHNSEQAFMWEKALCFNDFETAKEILKTSSPKNAKDLGRTVKNYNEEIWAKYRFTAMYEVCLAKFDQNPDRLETLLSTGNRTIVEASPYDAVWGVGLHWTGDEILDENNWKGQNLLGKVLMKVRDHLGNQI